MDAGGGTGKADAPAPAGASRLIETTRGGFTIVEWITLALAVGAVVAALTLPSPVAVRRCAAPEASPR